MPSIPHTSHVNVTSSHRTVAVASLQAEMNSQSRSPSRMAGRENDPNTMLDIY